MSSTDPHAGHGHDHGHDHGGTHTGPQMPPAPIAGTPPVVRQEVRSLTAEFRAAYVAALLELKKTGRYDQYVHWHHAVMHPTIHPDEPVHPNYRNGAHRGPSFLPWHRALLLAVEADLRSIDGSLSIPYWDWTIDAEMEDPKQSPVWSEDFMGGDGDPAKKQWVTTGPFAYENGGWPIPVEMDGPALKRQFGVYVTTLPTRSDVDDLAMREALYDTPPYAPTPFVVGFRNRLEGWITQRGDPRVKTPGSQLHNRVHLWVGGSMLPMTSPNDPVFFLHHAMVDKVWADWQAAKRADPEEQPWEPHYAPMRDGPPGHNFEDELKPFGRRISEMMDVAKLGYAYEPAPKPERAPEVFRAPSPFASGEELDPRDSPFWAD